MGEDRREIRTMCHEVRASPAEDGKGWRFEGYAAVFDSLSEDLGGFRERIARGAFTQALTRGDDVRALFNHDANYVLGRTTAGTLRLSEDDHGLRFEVDAPDVGWVRDLRESVKRGDINQCSFQFTVDKESWDESDKLNVVRTLEDVRLYDVSLVTYPAYAATSASARSLKRDEDKPDCWRRKLGARMLALKEKA